MFADRHTTKPTAFARDDIDLSAELDDCLNFEASGILLVQGPDP